MKKTVQKIRFNGLDFMLTDFDKMSSPIVTLADFKKGKLSYAQLYRNTGKIMQYTQQIGVIGDIEFGEIVEIEVDNTEFAQGLFEQIMNFQV